MGHDAGHLVGRAGFREQARVDHERAPGQGCGVDQVAFHQADVEPVARVRFDGCDEPGGDRSDRVGGRAGVDRLLAGEQLCGGSLTDQPFAGRRARRGDQVRGQPREEEPAGRVCGNTLLTDIIDARTLIHIG